jgi:hypothetical protein
VLEDAHSTHGDFIVSVRRRHVDKVPSPNISYEIALCFNAQPSYPIKGRDHCRACVPGCNNEVTKSVMDGNNVVSNPSRGPIPKVIRWIKN